MDELEEDLENQIPKRTEFISSAFLSENSTLDRDMLLFEFGFPIFQIPPINIINISFNVYRSSFAYNCKRLFNMCLIVPDILVFGSGNIIQFFNISTRQMEMRRTACGIGIGFITVCERNGALISIENKK